MSSVHAQLPHLFPLRFQELYLCSFHNQIHLSGYFNISPYEKTVEMKSLTMSGVVVDPQEPRALITSCVSIKKYRTHL